MKQRSSVLIWVFCLILRMANGQPPAPKAGEPVDLVHLGRVTGWADSEDEHAYSKDAGPPWRAIAEQHAHGSWNLGVEWDEPREFSEVHVTFQEHIPANSVDVEYWISAWPPAEGRGGWTATDTHWQGEWRPVHASSLLENGGMTFRFDPLGTEENPHAKNRPGYQPRFRRALRMRLRIRSSFLPVLTRFEVLGSSRRNERDVRIETGCEGTAQSDPTFDIYNGCVLEKRLDGDVIRLRLMYLEHQPGSNDGTILTVKARDLRFGVAIDDLIQRKGIYVRDAGVFVGDGADTFAPDEPVASWILRDLEDNLFMSPESFSVAEQDWFSRGGITLQPNLVNTAVTYLERDEPAHALRPFYNAFAASYYPDVNAFTEWEPSFGKSGGPFFKTSDEAGSIACLRLMLVREDGDTLYLASGAPRRWFAPDRIIQVEGAATFFGPVAFRIESHPDNGRVDATVRLPDSFRAKEIRLRLRHPGGKHFTRVEMDGGPWTQFDGVHEWIIVPVSAGTKNIRAFF